MENSNQPAFPIDTNDYRSLQLGLTKREYFAGLAMQGMASSAFWSENFTYDSKDLDKVMEVAVMAADCLLTALTSTPLK